MENYLSGIDENIWRSIRYCSYDADRLQAIGTFGTTEEMIARGSKENIKDKRCLHELHGAFPLVVHNYI